MTAILPVQTDYWDWPLQYCVQPVHLVDTNQISLSDTSVDYAPLIQKRGGKKNLPALRLFPTFVVSNRFVCQSVL